MAAQIATFVSKRLQRVSIALICLTMAQLMVVLASCHPEPLPMATRTAIGH
jgi:uncharacterized membrane protein YccC